MIRLIRATYAILLVALVGLPLLKPFTEIGHSGAWTWTIDDFTRLKELGWATLALTSGTLAIAMPVGVCLAVLLFRTTFPGQRLLLFFLAAALFIPLPVHVSSWQLVFGHDGLVPAIFQSSEADHPWTTGLAAAIWIHAIAATPWVAFIVGVGHHWVEPELEDEAAQLIGPFQVAALVTLPRVRASLLASALFITLQTAAETSVTEMMLVPTLAEETRMQFASHDSGLARTLLISLPMLLLVWCVAMLAYRYVESRVAPSAPAMRSLRPLNFGPPWLRLLIGAVLVLLLLIPLASIAWRIGLTGHPQVWNGRVAWRFLESGTRIHHVKLTQTVALALMTGGATAVIAGTGCWLAREARWFRWLFYSIAIFAWVLPAPVIGIGLHDAIWLLPRGPWHSLLLHGPSPLPMVWVQIVRALPIAVVFLGPIVRMIPRELFEEARLLGAGAIDEWTHVVVPQVWRGALITALACTALCLGEVSASARVETPGWESFTKLLLDHMHRGVDNTVAALCVLLLASLFVLGTFGTLLYLFATALRSNQ